MRINRVIEHQRFSGMLCPRPVVEMQILSPRLGWFDIDFLIDTGCPISVIPMADATSMRLEFPMRTQPFRLHVRGATRAGQLANMRVRFPRYPVKEFNWPCVFADQVTLPGPQSGTSLEAAEARIERARRLPCLLGTAGFLSRDFDMLIGQNNLTLYHRHDWWHPFRRWLCLCC